MTPVEIRFTDAQLEYLGRLDGSRNMNVRLAVDASLLLRAIAAGVARWEPVPKEIWVRGVRYSAKTWCGLPEVPAPVAQELRRALDKIL